MPALADHASGSQAPNCHERLPLFPPGALAQACAGRRYEDPLQVNAVQWAYARPVARVDPQDDDVLRFIVQHYRYDPERHERRHVLVAAFDNEQEFLTCINTVRAQIEGSKSRGEPVDPREHASGALLEPGYRRRAANGHLVMRALRHGVRPGPWLDELELPSNVSVESAAGPSA